MSAQDKQELSGTAGLLLGGGVSFLVVVAVLCVGTWQWSNYKERKAKRGWMLKTVPVLARTLPAGHTLGPGDVLEGELPEQFVTETLVKPVAAEWGGKPLVVEVPQGEPLRFADLGPLSCSEQVETHWRVVKPPPPAAVQAEDRPSYPQVDAVLEALRQQEQR